MEAVVPLERSGHPIHVAQPLRVAVGVTRVAVVNQMVADQPFDSADTVVMQVDELQLRQVGQRRNVDDLITRQAEPLEVAEFRQLTNILQFKTFVKKSGARIVVASLFADENMGAHRGDSANFVFRRCLKVGVTLSGCEFGQIVQVCPTDAIRSPTCVRSADKSAVSDPGQ